MYSVWCLHVYMYIQLCIRTYVNTYVFKGIGWISCVFFLFVLMHTCVFQQVAVCIYLSVCVHVCVGGVVRLS